MLFFILAIILIVAGLIIVKCAKETIPETAIISVFVGILLLCGVMVGMCCSQTPSMVKNELNARQEEFTTIQSNIKLINEGEGFTDEVAKAKMLTLKAETNLLIERFNKSLLEDKLHNESIWIGWFVSDRTVNFDTFERLQ